MSQLLSLLVVLLFVFDVSLVSARAPYLQSRSPDPVDISGLNTNAKRFGRGLTPLPPPLLKRNPTGVDSARRSAVSSCAKSGFIQVLCAETKKVKGYVSRELKANKSYTLTEMVDAGVFSSSVLSSGSTNRISLLDEDDGTHYLAGLIKKNEQLGDGNGDDKAAILGNSWLTSPNAPPQSNRDPSWNNRDAETAIWTYKFSDKSLTPAWINYVNQLPRSPTTSIYWLENGDKFYLTSSSTPPQHGKAVLFKYISIRDGC